MAFEDIVDLKISYEEIAEQIAAAGGWGDINGTASFIEDDASQYKFHIFPETVESFIQSGGSKDFAMSHMAKPYKLSDYPTVRIQAFNTKAGISGLLDIITKIGGVFGKKAAPGASGAVDSTSSANTKSIGEQFTEFVKSIPERIINAIGGLRDMISKSLSNPDLYYRKIPEAMGFSVNMAQLNNRYTLPLINLDRLIEVQGDFGWNYDGLISKIIGFAQGFLGSAVQPFFVPEAGGGQYPTITIQFPLFNDTIEHAQDNYKFIHTILPWNMWVQWGLAIVPAVLYDVSIDGGLRMKACAARMNVSYRGTMRQVDSSWRDAMGEIVTVPDVYILTCTFESILNSNFNHYLLSWSENELQTISRNIERDVAIEKEAEKRVGNQKQQSEVKSELEEPSDEEAAGREHTTISILEREGME